MSPKVELLKIRDFGEIITDTFVFVRENFKPLIQCFFIFCGFFLVASALFSALQQVKAVGVINNMGFGNSRSMFARPNPFDMLGIDYILAIVFLMLNWVAMKVTVFSYVCLYKEKGNIPPTPLEVWGYFKYFYLKIFGSGILLLILLVIGTMLCIVPGVYLYPIFGLVFPIIIFENTSFGYAFNKSFKLIKNNWWLTFGAIVIMVLIVYVASMVVVLPIAALNISNMVLHFGKGSHMSLPLALLTTVLQNLFQVIYILPIITVSLCYFSLSEQAEGTGLLGRINQLGSTGPAENLPREEF